MKCGNCEKALDECTCSKDDDDALLKKQKKNADLALGKTISKKRKRSVVKSVPVRLGLSGNKLNWGKKNFRFVTWNIQNFTGDLIKQGNNTIQSPIDSDKNRVRIAFIGQALVALNVQAMVIMEMGSDAETFLKALTKTLNDGICENLIWHYTFSWDVGATKTPPETLTVDYSEYRDPERRIWALETLLPYYKVTDLLRPTRTEKRHLDAQILLASLLGEEKLVELLETLGKDKFTHEDISDLILKEYPPETLKAEWSLEAITLLFTADSSILEISILEMLLKKKLFLAFALFAATSGSVVELESNGEEITTDGPRAALRFLGINIGRYEKYGLVWCTGLYEKYLLNELVVTDLLNESERTNSRAAMRFQLPLGLGNYLHADVIHSMWTPAFVPNSKDQSSNRELRMRTLEVQAGKASGLKRSERPLFIMGDTNVKTEDVEVLNERMEKHGYSRIGEIVPTTLRQETTLKRLGENKFFSEPYDAVYQDEERKNNFPTVVSFPDHQTSALVQLLLNLISRNKIVRKWYFDLLFSHYEKIEKCASLRSANLKVKTAVKRIITDAEKKAKVNSLEQDKDRETFLTELLLNWPKCDRKNNTTDSLGKKVALFLELRPDSERCYLLFHRYFISDHRMVLLDMAYRGMIGKVQKVKKTKGKRDSFLKSSIQKTKKLKLVTDVNTAITEAGFTRGTASGKGSNCFLYTLRQLTNSSRGVQDHIWASEIRQALALESTIPKTGFLDAADKRLQMWLKAFFSDYTFRIYTQNTVSGNLQLTHTIGEGNTTVNMLLHGDHFEPLW